LLLAGAQGLQAVMRFLQAGLGPTVVQHPAQHDHFAAEIKPQFAAGALFRIKGLGIRGIAEHRFAG
jgi:hypothetical protein